MPEGAIDFALRDGQKSINLSQTRAAQVSYEATQAPTLPPQFAQILPCDFDCHWPVRLSAV